MSSSDAQRSPVHHATEDSNVEPTGPAVRDPNLTPQAKSPAKPPT